MPYFVSSLKWLDDYIISLFIFSSDAETWTVRVKGVEGAGDPELRNKAYPVTET